MPATPFIDPRLLVEVESDAMLPEGEAAHMRLALAVGNILRLLNSDTSISQAQSLLPPREPPSVSAGDRMVRPRLAWLGLGSATVGAL